MNNERIIIIVLVLILIGIGGAWAYNSIQERSYQQGISDTVLLTNQEILNSLQQNGYVSFVYTIGNQTQRINLVPQQNG